MVLGSFVYWESALSSAIEVSIAIAGFSGIIAVFGRRNVEGWGIEEKLRMQILLTASAAAGLFSFLPFVLFEGGLEAEASWRIGSGTQCIWLLGISIYRSRQASIAGASSVVGIGNFMFPIFITNLLGQLVNTAIVAEAWLYLVGVLFQVTVGFTAFTTLLLGLWIQIDEDDAS